MSRSSAPCPCPGATYRVQFNRQFRFADATELLPYLDALGITHLYTAPFLKARSGSTHGYDVIDHNAFNPEVGDEESFDALAAGLARRSMGQILDFVPNHMGIGKADNAWWLDVLEWGQASPYARYFDIDWRQATTPVRGKVVLPFLGDSYGNVLESGQLQLRINAASGSFAVNYYDHLYPIAPRHYADILSDVAAETPVKRQLQELIDGFRMLRAQGISVARQHAKRQQAEVLKTRLAMQLRQTPGLLEDIEQVLGRYNGVPGDAASFIGLHRLLERQAYRLAYWRVAANEINYRRFFDINDLAGIRVEYEQVFDDVHRLVLRLLAEDKLQGLRIDHIDGLFDPQSYCERLQSVAAEVTHNSGQPLYLLVEKILARHERPRPGWPMAGTTGYELLNQINGLFMSPSAQRPMERFYRNFSGLHDSFEDVLTTAKREVVGHVLASDIEVLANLFSRLAETNWRTRDFTLLAIRNALTEIVVFFPVYRTYVSARGANVADRRDIDWAIGRARRHNRLIDAGLFSFIGGVLTADLSRPRSGFNRNQVLRLAMRFQQYTGPVMAKSLEDTAFYRYFPLLSLNEVGGEPSQFGVSVAAFHQYIRERAAQWPHALVSTGTHDSKRGEDVRARLNALTGRPEEWASQVRRWARLNRSLRTSADEEGAPSRNDEYLLYQTLVGSWPADWSTGSIPDKHALEEYRQRIDDYMIKAIREAKLRSSWLHPDPAYEDAVSGFVNALLQHPDNTFVTDMTNFVEQLAPAGVANSLGQLALKFTLPGVPDVYQGDELWNLNLVDPDNRRPVDYALRTMMLDALRARTDEDPVPLVQELCRHWPDGRLKLFMTWKLLALRRRLAELFIGGTYHPLKVRGRYAESVCAYTRAHHGSRVVTIVACHGIANLNGGLNVDGDDTALELSGDSLQEELQDIFTGARFTAGVDTDPVALSSLLAHLPVAVLAR